MNETKPVKRIFFVDYENVSISGLDGVTKLDANDEVYIFYSTNADKLTFGLHRRLNETKAKIHYKNVIKGSKNALDFQLASLLGYTIRENMDSNNGTIFYYIVSKDLGFSCLENFWEKTDILVSVVKNVALDKKSELIAKVKACIKEESEAEFVANIIEKYKTKQGINNALVKKYKDGAKAKEIYQAIKKLIEDKK